MPAILCGVYGLKDGERRHVQIYDLSGHARANYTVVRSAGQISVETDADLTCSVVEHMMKNWISE